MAEQKGAGESADVSDKVGVDEDGSSSDVESGATATEFKEARKDETGPVEKGSSAPDLNSRMPD